jgi:putative endonuclease
MQKGVMYNKRRKGSFYEEKAVSFLKEKGYIILEQNFYSHHLEIDIIAKDKDYLVFIEVKYRKDDEKGNPLESVTFRKRMNIIKAAKQYIQRYYYGRDINVRFDVISICGEEMNLIKDAFWIE